LSQCIAVSFFHDTLTFLFLFLFGLAHGVSDVREAFEFAAVQPSEPPCLGNGNASSLIRFGHQPS